MEVPHIRKTLEARQIPIYLCSVALAVAVALSVPGTAALEEAVNPALALMLYTTFLQLPMGALKRSFGQPRFLAALFVANFIVIPVLVGILLRFAPSDPMVRLGVLLVLLTPCIDYVVTFSQLGRANARSLLAATPWLLVVQMLLLPGYLGIFLGAEAGAVVQWGPFVHAFVWLIAAPLSLAALAQWVAARSTTASRVAALLELLTVPATALVLFVVVATVVPQLTAAAEAALNVIRIYLTFAIVAPLAGWFVARGFRLDTASARSVAFSSGTRNSLVVLPLSLAVPGAIPLLPAIIVTQTLVELVAELGYVRLVSKLGRDETEV